MITLENGIKHNLFSILQTCLYLIKKKIVTHSNWMNLKIVLKELQVNFLKKDVECRFFFCQI